MVEQSLPVVEWASISEEDDLVELCQKEPVLVEGVAKLLLVHIKQLMGIARPFTLLKAWLRKAVPEGKCVWATQRFDILTQWIAALSLLVPGFVPEPFKFSDIDDPIQIPALVRGPLLCKFKGIPHAGGNSHREPGM